MRISELMTRDVIAATPRTPLKEVVRLMLEHRISGVPVIDNDGIVIGVVSESDLLLKERGREAARPSPLTWLVGEPRDSRHARTVIDATIAESAMSSPAVNRLPVTDSGHLVGIVSRSDLLRPFLRSDGQIADAVRFALHAADGIQVDSVVRGIVQLSGQAASREMAETAIRVAESIDGVMAVRASRLTFPEPAVVTVIG